MSIHSLLPPVRRSDGRRTCERRSRGAAAPAENGPRTQEAPARATRRNPPSRRTPKTTQHFIANDHGTRAGEKVSQHERQSTEATKCYNHGVSRESLEVELSPRPARMLCRDGHDGLVARRGFERREFHQVSVVAATAPAGLQEALLDQARSSKGATSKGAYRASLTKP